MSRHEPTNSGRWVWNPYAETHDLVVDTIEDVEVADNAARGLAAVIDGMPGWLVDETELRRALEILENVTVKESIDDVDDDTGEPEA